MRRITKALVLMLMVGLLWPGCDNPTGSIPDVGDCMCLTNDARPNYDPFLFESVDI